MRNIKLSTVSFYIGFLCFKLLLDLSYVKVIAPQYGYMGFSLSQEPAKIFAGIVLFFLLLLFVPIKFSKPSEILGFGLFTMTYPPALTLFSYGGASFSFILINTVFWLVAFCVLRLLPTISLPQISEKAGKIIFLTIIFLTCAYVIFFVVKTFGFHINLNIMGVYDQREQYKAANIPLSNYLFTWSSNVILPMGFLYLLKEKKYFLSLIPLLSILLLFSATGMKSMLFTIPIVLIFALFLQSEKVNLWLMGILVSVTLGCFLIFICLDEILPISLFTRRVFMVPAQISNYYCEFFQTEGEIRLGHSIFSSFVPYRFETEPAKFMSRIFVGTESNFNTGIVGDGFANFGYIGVFCWAAFMAFVLKLLDCVSFNKDKTVAIAGYIMFLSSFSNSALVTNLGTHGVLIGILMLYILPMKKLDKSKQHKNTKRRKGLCLTNENLHNDECSQA